MTWSLDRLICFLFAIFIRVYPFFVYFPLFRFVYRLLRAHSVESLLHVVYTHTFTVTLISVWKEKKTKNAQQTPSIYTKIIWTKKTKYTQHSGVCMWFFWCVTMATTFYCYRFFLFSFIVVSVYLLHFAESIELFVFSTVNVCSSIFALTKLLKWFLISCFLEKLHFSEKKVSYHSTEKKLLRKLIVTLWRDAVIWIS